MEANDKLLSEKHYAWILKCIGPSCSAEFKTKLEMTNHNKSVHNGQNKFWNMNSADSSDYTACHFDYKCSICAFETCGTKKVSV